MDQTLYYSLVFSLSLLFTVIYVSRWKKQFSTDMTAYFILLPVVCLSYLLLYTNPDMTTAAAMLRFVYVGACFLPWIMTMCQLDLCKIKVADAVRVGTFLVSAGVFIADHLLENTTLLYRGLSFERAGGAWVLLKEYGPFQTVHYVFIICYLIADITIMAYSFRKKKQVSGTVLLLLSLPIVICIIGYLAGSPFARAGYELTPLTYILTQAVYLLIVRRMAYYNVGEMIIESMAETGDVGFVTVDSRTRYLGSNETAREILPALNGLKTDRPVSSNGALRDTLLYWMERYRENRGEDHFTYTPSPDGEKTYSVRVSDLYYGKKRVGYQFFIEDDTANQKYIKLINNYNAELQTEVAAKTDRIVRMNESFVLGMAAMVESRDNSTGGHVRRTSEGVRLLIEEIKKDGAFTLSDGFCEKTVKAAPMHDLGKIAVDDAVLRKPGRYTPEEFDKMKTHAAEGARIVRDILKDVDDGEFLKIAENVAHYHHERFDGSGYPEGLKGGEIPLEARIMAVADVYDALVSERVYKESYSFEKADAIILEGMGTQFDPALRPYYEAARPGLEEYYAGVKGGV